VAALHVDGRGVYAANCDTEEDLHRAYELGVNCLSTARLELALRVREQHHDGRGDLTRRAPPWVRQLHGDRRGEVAVLVELGALNRDAGSR
jgi:hypothetical protein